MRTLATPSLHCALIVKGEQTNKSTTLKADKLIDRLAVAIDICSLV